MSEWSKEPDLRPGSVSCEGSNPSSCKIECNIIDNVYQMENLTMDMNALNTMDTLCPDAKEYMFRCADKGMGYLLSAAGGDPNWIVIDDVVHWTATIIVRMMQTDTLTNGLTKREIDDISTTLIGNDKQAMVNLTKKVQMFLRSG